MTLSWALYTESQLENSSQSHSKVEWPKTLQHCNCFITDRIYVDGPVKPVVKNIFLTLNLISIVILLRKDLISLNNKYQHRQMPRDCYSMTVTSPSVCVYTNIYTLIINASNTKANNNKQEEKTCMTTRIYKRSLKTSQKPRTRTIHFGNVH